MAFGLLFSLDGLADAHISQDISLWGDKKPPFARDHTAEEYEADCFGVRCAYQVVNPTLRIFRPTAGGNGNAVIILPGGGYEVEAVYHEGYEIAERLAAMGNLALVLKYRLPDPQTATQPQLVPRLDVQEALRWVRENPAEYDYRVDRVGVMGFSAGSHLATSVSVNRSDDALENPDFSMLIYGVTQMSPTNRQWLEDTLYHRAMTGEEVAFESFLERVDANTPPAFLAHSLDDDVCPYQETTLYAEALLSKGVLPEVHLFPTGGHGFGPGRAEDGTDQWLDLAGSWLNRLAAD